MSEDQHESYSELQRCKFDATSRTRSHDVSSNANDEQVTETLIENDLRRNPRVGASENDGKRLLARHNFVAVLRTGARLTTRRAGGKALIPLAQAFERLWCGDRWHFFLVQPSEGS